AALRVLHCALEGLRSGVPPHVIVEGKLGEAIETLWDHLPKRVDPLIVRVFHEILRQIRRAGHADIVFASDKSEWEAFAWQRARLIALDPLLEPYLAQAAEPLLVSLAESGRDGQRDILHALAALRAEAAPVLLPLLEKGAPPHVDLALELLAFSKDVRVGPWLRAWAARRIPMDRRAMQRRRAVPPRQPSVPADVPYRAILRALRGHPSPETEGFLLLAACDWHPVYRAAAVGSLGWWGPLPRHDVLHGLQMARRDLNPEVRQTARAALARLGERQALQWFRQALQADKSHRVHEAIQLIA